jgi:hypothetical protein
MTKPDWIPGPREKVEDAGRSVRRARPARLALLPLTKRDGVSSVAHHKHGTGRFDA